MAIWAIYAYDNVFEGFGGYKKTKVIRGTLEHAYEVGRSMSRDIIDSSPEINNKLQENIYETCYERSVPFNSPLVEEIRNIIYMNDEAWECIELDEEKLPKESLETLNYIYEKEGYTFILKFEKI